MNIEHHLYINAPVQEVFNLIDDKEKLKLWMEDLVEIKYFERPCRENPVGAQFIQTIREGNGTAAYTGEVIAYDKLRHLALTIGNRRFRMQVDYRFVGDAGQTRFDYRVQMIEGTWFMRLTGKLFESFTRRILYNQMWRLKAVAEACTPGNSRFNKRKNFWRLNNLLGI